MAEGVIGAETHVGELIAAASPALRRSVLPVLSVGRNGRPEPVASCVLVQVDGKNVILTAGHVQADWFKDCWLHIQGANGPVAIKNSGIRTGLSGGFDPLDIWIVPPSDEEVLGLGEILFLTALDERDFAGPDNLCVAAGYPVASHGRNPTTGALRIRFRTFGASQCWPQNSRAAPAMGDLAARGFDPKANFAVHFNRTHLRAAGINVSAPMPYGMSGGAVFCFPNWFNSETRLLTAILTTWLQRERAMVATRLSTIIQAVRESVDLRGS